MKDAKWRGIRDEHDSDWEDSIGGATQITYISKWEALFSMIVNVKK